MLFELLKRWCKRYATAIGACAKAFQWETVLRLLDAMERAGLAPNLRRVTNGIAAGLHMYSKAQMRRTDSHTTPERRTKACRRIPQHQRGSQAKRMVKKSNFVKWINVVRVWCLCVSVHGVCAWCARGVWWFRCFNAALDGCHRSGRWEAALGLLDLMADK